MPNISDDDEEMHDATPLNPETPNVDGEEVDGDVEEDEEPEDAEDAGTPVNDSDPPSRSGTPRRRGRNSMLLSRKRRLGRPPKTREAASDDEGTGAASDTVTPRRGRGGFRGHRGGRWAKKYGPAPVQVPIDRDGNMMDVVDDEVDLPEIPEGETKVDKNGVLQDDREYRVRTFTIIGREKRLYMLSTEPARCIGFRDSYLFFQRHKMLYKIILDEDEKLDLVARDVMPHSYKGRAIGVVTARSVFREFGAKIVVAGKKVVDDYDAQGARDRGDIEGELAVPEDLLPGPGETYNRNQYVAWHGASAVYHTNAPSMPMPNGKMVDGKRKKVQVTSDNWMLEHAREASRFNHTLAENRRAAFNGVYDIQTNIVQYPRATQPTHARWEAVDDEDTSQKEANMSENHEDANKPQNQKDANMAQKPHQTSKHEAQDGGLSKLESVFSRNFRIHDTYLERPPESNFDSPGLDKAPTNLLSIPDNILDELPPECRKAFEEAKEKELSWKTKWLTEKTDGLRSDFRSSTSWWL